METIDTFIFVQGFVWGIFLLRRHKSGEAWLGLAFLVTGIYYFLDYATKVYDLQIPGSIVISVVLLIFLLITYHHYKSLVLSESWKLGVPVGLVVLFALLLFCQCLFLTHIQKNTLIIAGVAGILLLITDALLLGNRIRKKTYTGGILDTLNYRLNFQLLALKALMVGIVFFQDTTGLIHMLLQILLALLIFFAGYTAVQYSFTKKSIRKIHRRKSDVDKLGRDVILLMEEQKPYLDCELTLGKVAAMLDMTEHELSSLLHTGMHTSFYDLINGYRIETVKEKLIQPDAIKYTIMSAAYESGFNSRSTFYRIFKEYTGMQPREFIEKKADR